MINIYTASKLEKDKFKIPILPDDKISINKKGLINTSVYVFTNITPEDEKYAEIVLQNIDPKQILPDFTYIKPDPQGKDPREVDNIKYINEKKLGKIRKNYVLLGLLPNEDTPFTRIWGMRNHLHKASTLDNPGIICAVYDKDTGWSTRTYFETDSIEFENGRDVLTTCKNLIENS